MRCVTSQNRADLIDNPLKAWNHARGP